MADTPILRPKNDVNVVIGPFETIEATTAKTALTSGVTGFIAVAETPDQTAADVTLNAPVITHVGGEPKPAPLSGTWPQGYFNYQQDHAPLTDELCEAKFAARGEAFIHAIHASGIRIVVRMEYQRARLAVMA